MGHVDAVKVATMKAGGWLMGADPPLLAGTVAASDAFSRSATVSMQSRALVRRRSFSLAARCETLR